jgi:carboxypeptidase Taq
MSVVVPMPASPKKSSRRSPEHMLNEVRVRLQEISDLSGAAAVLNWDQATHMPSGGAASRARQCARVSRIAHERMMRPALGRLLDALVPYGESLPPDSDDARLIAVTRREFERVRKVPPRHVQRANAIGAASYHAWTKARPANDFAAMRPYLEHMIDLSREYASFFGHYSHIADPLIDDVDEGMTYASVRALLADLRSELVPLVRAVCEQPVVDTSCLQGQFAPEAQVEFGLSIACAFGYDLTRGRLDRSPHPFCTKFSRDDVRITTRVRADELTYALFSTLHEAGHAMYEQGVAPALAGTPLGQGASMGVHESQSRLWENVVGRSRDAWEHYFPKLQRVFPDQLGNASLQRFYCAINKVEKTLIRTEADELTYNLHIILRFDLETELLEGRLAVKDLPEAWRARYQRDLAIAPPDDRDGCLQDVHWYGSGVGAAFPSYTIGNVLSAQFYAAALRAHPDIPQDMRAGEFVTLHGWLSDNLYRHGRKFTPAEVVQRATGEPITIKHYVNYLRKKYGELYGLRPAAAFAQ